MHDIGWDECGETRSVAYSKADIAGALFFIGPLVERKSTDYDMQTYTSQIPRDIAAQYGRETVSIGEGGRYVAPSGRVVDLRAQVETAVQSTISYPPNVPLGTTFIGQHDTEIEVTNETTLSAAARLIQQGFKTVALNFASAPVPEADFSWEPEPKRSIWRVRPASTSASAPTPCTRFIEKHTTPFTQTMFCIHPRSQ
jgi:hypothetical protein